MITISGQGIWRIFPKIGYQVIIPWPNTDKSCDPNIIIRPWLEKNVGKQGLHWSWCLHNIDKIEVRFLDKRHLLIFTLIYG